MIFLICEWAVTDHRKSFQNRDIFVATLFCKLLSLPQAAFLAYSTLLSSSGGPQVSVFQRALYLFVDNYNFKSTYGKTNKKQTTYMHTYIRTNEQTHFQITTPITTEKVSMVMLLGTLSKFDFFSYNEYVKTLVCRSKLRVHAFFVENTPCVLRVTPETLVPLLGREARAARESEESQRQAIVSTGPTRKEAEERLKALLLLLQGTAPTEAEVHDFVEYFGALCLHDKFYVSDWLTDMFFVKSCPCERVEDGERSERASVLCFCKPDPRRLRIALTLLEEAHNSVSLAAFLLRVLKSPRYAGVTEMLLLAVLSVAKNMSVFYALDAVPRLLTVLKALYTSLAKDQSAAAVTAEDKGAVLVPLLLKKLYDVCQLCDNRSKAAMDPNAAALCSALIADRGDSASTFGPIAADCDFARARAVLDGGGYGGSSSGGGCRDCAFEASGLVRAGLALVQRSHDVPSAVAFFTGLFDAIEGEPWAYLVAESFFMCLGQCAQQQQLDQGMLDFLCSLVLNPRATALRKFIEPYRVVDIVTSGIGTKRPRQLMQGASHADAGVVAAQRLRALLQLSDYVTSWKPVGSVLSYVANAYGGGGNSNNSSSSSSHGLGQFPQELGELFADERAKVKDILCGHFEYFAKVFQKCGFLGSEGYMSIMQGVLDAGLPAGLRTLPMAQALDALLGDILEEKKNEDERGINSINSNNSNNNTTSNREPFCSKWQLGLVLCYLMFNLYRDPEGTKNTFARILFTRLFMTAEGDSSGPLSCTGVSVALNMYASVVNLMGDDAQAAFMEVVKSFVTECSCGNTQSLSDYVSK